VASLLSGNVRAMSCSAVVSAIWGRCGVRKVGIEGQSATGTVQQREEGGVRVGSEMQPDDDAVPRQ
jgi:hypothetical protein